MDRADFTNEDNWAEYIAHQVVYPDYAICIELNFHIFEVVDYLWTHPSLTGPWGDKLSFMGPTEYPNSLSMYGLITIDGFESIGCESSILPDVNQILYLEIPARMMQHIVKIQMPFNPEHNPWIPIFEQAFAQIGDFVYARYPFDEATIGGWGGYVNRYRPDNTEFSEKEIVERGGFLLSPARWTRLQPEVASVELASGLRWIPRVIYV